MKQIQVTSSLLIEEIIRTREVWRGVYTNKKGEVYVDEWVFHFLMGQAEAPEPAPLHEPLERENWPTREEDDIIFRQLVESLREEEDYVPMPPPPRLTLWGRIKRFFLEG